MDYNDKTSIPQRVRVKRALQNYEPACNLLLLLADIPVKRALQNYEPPICHLDRQGEIFVWRI
jgi:phage baseplate assembly protein W